MKDGQADEGPRKGRRDEDKEELAVKHVLLAGITSRAHNLRVESRAGGSKIFRAL